MKKEIYQSFTEEDMKNFQPTMKIGLVASVNQQGLPHITLLASLQASTEKEMVWGQFTEGSVYEIVKNNPKTAFLIMNMDKELWRGKMLFKESRQEGIEFEMYNNTPMFRYNAYFGVHTVHYLDLIEHYGREELPMGKIIFSAILTQIAKVFAGGGKEEVLNPWTRKLIDKIGNLKFISYVGQDGFPVIVPVIQAGVMGKDGILFESSVYADELKKIPVGVPMAVFGMELNMTDVVLRGTWQGLKRVGGVRCGSVKIDWVYNAMPPNPQQIYPPRMIEAVEEF